MGATKNKNDSKNNAPDHILVKFWSFTTVALKATDVFLSAPPVREVLNFLTLWALQGTGNEIKFYLLFYLRLILTNLTIASTMKVASVLALLNILAKTWWLPCLEFCWAIATKGQTSEIVLIILLQKNRLYQWTFWKRKQSKPLAFKGVLPTYSRYTKVYIIRTNGLTLKYKYL